MRKNYYSLLIIPIFILGLLFACTTDFSDLRVDDSFVNYEEDLTLQSINADDFSAADFAFTAISDWETQTDDDWISTYPESGVAGDSSIEIHTSGNYTGVARRGTLYIVSGLYKIAVIIDQSEYDKNGAMPEDPDYIFVVEEGSENMSIYADKLDFAELVVYTPDSWTRELTFDEGVGEWLTVTGAEKGSEGSYTFTIKANAVNFTGDVKSAKLTFALTDAAFRPDSVEDLVITLTQTDKDADGNEVQLEFAYEDASDRYVDAGTTDFESFVFSADADWTAESTGDWFTVSPSSGVAGSYTMKIAANAINTTGVDKTGSVKITYDNDPAEDPSEVNIALTQRSTVNGGSFVFGFSNATDAVANLNYAVDTTTITFDSPFVWSATSDSSWLTVSPASGAVGTNCTVTLTSSLNTVKEDRTAIVTLKSAVPDYDGNYAVLTYEVTQVENPDGELPITYSTTLAKFDSAEFYEAYLDGKYVLEITDSGVVTDADLLTLETYLKGGDGAPDNGTVVLSMPNVTRILTTADSDATGNESDGYVFNGSSAIRELWLPNLTNRPYRLWNVYYLEVLYMPKAGGALTYVLFKNSGNKTTSGGMSVIAWGTDAAAGEITLVSSTTKAFMTTGDLSACTFYTNASNYNNFLTALNASNITYGELIVGEYDPQGTGEEEE